MEEESNTSRFLAKIVIAVILFVVVAGGISVIAGDQADGFGTVVIILVLILAIFGLGRALIER